MAKKKKTIDDISVKECFEIIAAWEAQADAMEDRNAAVEMWKKMAEMHVKNQIICARNCELACAEAEKLMNPEREKMGEIAIEWLNKEILCRARAEHCIKRARTAAFTTRLDWARRKVENLEYVIQKAKEPNPSDDNRNGMKLLCDFYSGFSAALLPDLEEQLVEAKAEVAELLPQYQIHKDFCKKESELKDEKQSIRHRILA